MTIHRATPEEHQAGELTEEQKADLDRRRSEDFKFMVLCASKNNMAMYHLMRDRDLDNYKESLPCPPSTPA